MDECSPIYSSKQPIRRIGYVAGDAAFDLSGRRRAEYNQEKGILCDLQNGRIVGYVSLQGRFVGSSWIAEELFPENDEITHQESPYREDYVNGPGLVGAAGIIGQSDAEYFCEVNDISETASSPPSANSEAAPKLPSASGHSTRQGERFSSDPDSVVWGRIFGQPENVTPVSSTGKAPTSLRSEMDEALARTFLKSDDDPNRERSQSERSSSSPGTPVADAISNDSGVLITRERFGQYESEDVSRSGIKQNSTLSDQDEWQARVFSKSDDDSHPETPQNEPYSNRPGELVAVETFMRGVAEYVYSTKETPGLPASTQDSAGAKLFPKSGDDTQHLNVVAGEIHDLAERAVRMIRGELAKVGNPGDSGQCSGRDA